MGKTENPHMRRLSMNQIFSLIDKLMEANRALKEQVEKLKGRVKPKENEAEKVRLQQIVEDLKTEV